uniref:Uncharacterized protein n=1 Tax=Cynoglossus semilaevis TaxID=244447 RepID=A0A3P8UGS4_CYNSE
EKPTDLSVGDADQPLVYQFVCFGPYLDSSAPAFSDSIRHSSTRRVNHGYEADETQVVGGEVHFISVKGKAFWELVIRQTEMAETWKEDSIIR